MADEKMLVPEKNDSVILESTPDYRWNVRMERGADQKVLQRAWVDRNTGQIYWKDVPEVVTK